jgi:hypothetical protein
LSGEKGIGPPIHTIVDPGRMAAKLRLVRTSLPITLAALIGVGMPPFSLQADYLKNTDLKEGLAGWHGDGEAAFLNPDGTEGAEGDKGVIPVIKITLSKGEPRSVYQEYETRDNPKTLHFKVDIFASIDYQRSKSIDDYTPQLIDYSAGDFFQWNVIGVCNVDFWIRAGPDWHYKLAKATVGKWFTVDYKFTNAFDTDTRSVYFCVPPGEGTLYLKNPSATP